MWSGSAVAVLAIPLVLLASGSCDDSSAKDIVIRTIPINLDQLKHLQDLWLQDVDLDFWKEPTKLGRSVDIHLTKSQQEKFFQSLQKYGISHEVIIPDVQKLILEEKRNDRAGWSYWTAYESIENIETFLRRASSQFYYVDLIDFGDSFEGRDLWVLRINKPNSNGAAKKVVWLDANIHAREWITSAVATWIINELLTNPSLNDVLEQWDIYINPILNPDGLQYSKTKDRFWRKTMSPNQGSNCVGTDPNRNWDYYFGVSSSSNPCKETYHGSRAFSEPETAAASQYISRLSPKPTMYLSLHSYSQLILLPYGMHWKPADYNELIYIAKLAEAEIERVGGGKWDSVSVFEKFGYISGGAHDWAKAKAGIKYSYTFELRDRGNYGFLLPPGQIIPAAKETWAGILAMMKFLS